MYIFLNNFFQGYIYIILHLNNFFIQKKKKKCSVWRPENTSICGRLTHSLLNFEFNYILI